ncbi:hypothetical protein Sm713_15580 [Streptomyces sp. TS71-3]|nr:hypothetical protein Sm713_15580 [Streptomyces sp. TS71-3]
MQPGFPEQMHAGRWGLQAHGRLARRVRVVESRSYRRSVREPGIYEVCGKLRAGARNIGMPDFHLR